MKKKLFIKALTVCLLLTLFSCSGEIRVEGNTENVSSPTTSVYKEKTISLSINDKLHEIVTPKDTFLVFSRYRSGAVLLKQSPVK